MKLYYIETDITNPWHNLALEEYLMDRIGEGDAMLYLWQNQNTVVIGKNQNAWKECRSEFLEQEGGCLARRSSGGGAVFHDLGNLNFTFLMSSELYDLEKQLGVVLGALRNLGIEAEFSGRNDLVVDGRKFSGNAFRYRKHAILHHGTLLVHVDYDKMTRYLSVSKDKIASKGIDSVRSRVINLTELKPELTIPRLKAALLDAFQAVYGGTAAILIPPSEEELATLYGRYASWDWRYGQSPQFDITLTNRFPWGGVDLCLTARDGIIERGILYSDAMDEAFIEHITQRLPGTPLRSDAMAEVIESIASENPQVAQDLSTWIREKHL